jgi:hypothetical protein
MRRLSALERLPLLGPIKTGFSYKRAAIAEAPTFDYWSVLPQARGTLKSLLILDLSRNYAALLTQLGCLAFEDQWAFASQR